MLTLAAAAGALGAALSGLGVGSLTGTSVPQCAADSVASMRSAKAFFAPLAVGAPTPIHEVPARPSRMIHFFDPSNDKMAAKVPDLVGNVDILLGNLEDAVKADRKVASTTWSPSSRRSATSST